MPRLRNLHARIKAAISGPWGRVGYLHGHQKIVLDPSRVAAQVVSGIGFIGAGLIFVRQEYVRGLTTAASVWLVAAVGLAAGAGMWEIALVATVLGLAVVEGLELFEDFVLHDGRPPTTLRVTYLDDDATAFGRIATLCGIGDGDPPRDIRLQRKAGDPPTVTARIHLRQGSPPARLAGQILAIDGVVEVDIESSE